MKMGFAIQKPLDLNKLGAAISSLINSLGVQGRIQITELDNTLEFVFDTKDVFDFDEYGQERSYIVEKGK